MWSCKFRLLCVKFHFLKPYTFSIVQNTVYSLLYAKKIVICIYFWSLWHRKWRKIMSCRPCCPLTVDFVHGAALPFQIEFSTLNACSTYSLGLLSVLMLCDYMFKDQWLSKWRWRSDEGDGKINRTYICHLLLIILNTTAA